MRTNSLGNIFAALLLIASTAASADEYELYRLSTYGPERIRLFALTRVFDVNSAAVEVTNTLQNELSKQGYYFNGSSGRILRQDVSLYPVVGYDGNINGGVLNDRFKFGDLSFEADPKIRSKSGIVYGGGLSTTTRISLREGTIADLSGVSEFTYSGQHDISRHQSSLSACLRDNIIGWTFFDICQNYDAFDRELGRSTRYSSRAILSSVFQSSIGYHEKRIELERVDFGGYDQNMVTAALKSVTSNYLSSFYISFGESILSETATKWRAAADISFPIDERLYGLSAWMQHAEGGQFLGVQREDDLVGFSISAEITATTSISLSYISNESTSDFFEYDQFGFQLVMRRYQW